MSLNEEVELLRNIPLFAKLETSKLKLLAFASERVIFADGQELFRQGDPGDSAYVVLKGQADVVIASPAGEITVARLGKNDIIGEIAILCDVPRTATLRAVGELITLAISKELFFRMVSEFPQMAIEIMRELAQRLERTNQQLREAVAARG
jgi:CRP-like cAMP-binding protein